MAGRRIARAAGAGVVVLLGVALTAAGATGWPQRWLQATGLAAPTSAGARNAAVSPAGSGAMAALPQREAAVQARELALADRERALSAREVEWVRAVQRLATDQQTEGHAQMAGLLEKMPPGPAAERLAGIEATAAARILLLLSEEQAAAVLAQMETAPAAQLIQAMGRGGSR